MPAVHALAYKKEMSSICNYESSCSASFEWSLSLSLFTRSATLVQLFPTGLPPPIGVSPAAPLSWRSLQTPHPAGPAPSSQLLTAVQRPFALRALPHGPRGSVLSFPSALSVVHPGAGPHRADKVHLVPAEALSALLAQTPPVPSLSRTGPLTFESGV